MRDITDLMDHYREVARSLWNRGFRSEPDLRHWNSRDHFEEIKTLLFKALVAARLQENECCDLGTLPEPAYHVVPLEPGPVPIMINRPRDDDRNRYWDDPIRAISASDAELHFIDYFDWNSIDYADFQYYRVRIADFGAQPHLIGREALLEHRYARVFASLRIPVK